MNVNEISLRESLIIGDVHGNQSAFLKAVEYAEDNNLHLISLGDIVDYGHGNDKVVKALSYMIRKGKASLVIGNHDYKLYRFFSQRRSGEIRVTLTDYQRDVTVPQLDAISDEFIEMIDQSSPILVMGDNVFAHAAISSKFWANFPRDKKMFDKAMYGYFNNDKLDYHWVKQIPRGKRVFIGHDIMLNVIIQYNKYGGRLVMMDTGCSKEGYLSGYNLYENRVITF